MKETYTKILIPKTSRYLSALKATMNFEVWGQVDEKYNVLVCPYRNFTPIKFIDHVEFSALLLVDMTLAKNWCAK